MGLEQRLLHNVRFVELRLQVLVELQPGQHPQIGPVLVQLVFRIAIEGGKIIVRLQWHEIGPPGCSPQRSTLPVLGAVRPLDRPLPDRNVIVTLAATVRSSARSDGGGASLRSRLIVVRISLHFSRGLRTTCFRRIGLLRRIRHNLVDHVGKRFPHVLEGRGAFRARGILRFVVEINVFKRPVAQQLLEAIPAAEHQVPHFLSGSQHSPCRGTAAAERRQ